MKLVMTLLARDEADIVDAQIAFHLNAGVDFVVATDNGSEDSTPEILRSYASEGYLDFTSNPDRGYSQIGVVTDMARRATTEFGADWVVNTDADEFWWPRGGTLKDVLTNVPARFGSVRGMWRNFVPRPHVDDAFAERMTVRLCEPTHGRATFNPHFKTVHRADPFVRVGGGNHEVHGRSALPVRGWHPIDILHFPIRSLEQCGRRYLRQWEFQTRAGQVPAPQPAAAYAAHREGRMREFYEALIVDDDVLKDGLGSGKYAEDTRLRDALRAIRCGKNGAVSTRATLARAATALDFSALEVDEAYLREVALLAEGDELVRVQRRIEALEARMVSLEAGLRSRLSSALTARSSG